jgi:transcriptional regulator with XRE-family HTH domain
MYKVGRQLKAKREELNLSIDDVVKKTRIQRVFIEALENNNYSFITKQDYYHQVFAGKYAQFLGLDKNTILAELDADKEYYYKMQESHKHKKPEDGPVQVVQPRKSPIKIRPHDAEKSEETNVDNVDDVTASKKEVDEKFAQLLQDINNNAASVQNANEAEYFTQDIDKKKIFDVEQHQDDEIEKEQPFDEYGNTQLDDVLPVVDTSTIMDNIKEEQEEKPVDIKDVDYLATNTVQPEPSYDDLYIKPEHAHKHTKPEHAHKHIKPSVTPIAQSSEVNEQNTPELTKVTDDLQTKPLISESLNVDDAKPKDVTQTLIDDSLYDDIDKLNKEVEATKHLEDQKKTEETVAKTLAKENIGTDEIIDSKPTNLKPDDLVALTKGIDLQNIDPGFTLEPNIEDDKSNDTQAYVESTQEIPVIQPATQPLPVDDLDKTMNKTNTLKDFFAEDGFTSALDKAKDEAVDNSVANKIANPSTLAVDTNTVNQDIAQTSKLDQIIEDKNKDLQNTSQLEEHLTQLNKDNVDVNPLEETKQMKVAKALGDNLTSEEEAKVKRAKMIDAILVILIILLAIYLLYLLFTNKIF